MPKAYVGEKIFQNINIRDAKGKLVNANLSNPNEGLLGWIPVFKTKKDLEKALGKGIKSSSLTVPK